MEAQMARSNSFREGVIAGVIGASAVAVWFFVADTIAGEPLRTPLLLAQAGAAVFGGDVGENALLAIIAYTLFHYAAFIVFGLIASKVIAASNRSPGHFAGLVLMFAAIQAGFYGLCLTLSMVDVIGALAWYQIMAANLLAAMTMGTYLLRLHPEAVRGIDAALKGTTP
jgi:hypothetical protein